MTDTGGAAFRKRLAIEAAGIRPQFPMSPWEPSSEQKFDALWPSSQAKYLRRADAMLAARTSGTGVGE